MIVLVRDYLMNIVTVRKDLMSEDFPSIWLNLTSHTGSKLLCGLFYHLWQDTASSTSLNDQTSRLEIFLEQLERAANQCKHVVVLGDANIDVNRYDDPTYQLRLIADLYRSRTSSLGFKQFSLGMTFVANKRNADGSVSSSSIDHLLSSQPN